MRQRARSTVLFAFWFLALCGAVAGGLVARRIPAAIADHKIELRQERYDGRWQDHPFEIDDAHRLPVPFAFADFDLQMEVELGDGARVDLLMRIVEPRFIDEVKEPFSGRFTALRLCTQGGGQGWYTREQALLGDRAAGGVELAPGIPATIWIQGRGRALRANVAGRWLPWFEAEDAFGSFLFVARGGNAVVRSLAIEPLEPPWPWWSTPTAWVVLGATVGLALAIVATALALSAWPVGALLVLAAWLLGRGDVPKLWLPPPALLAQDLAAAAAIALCVRRRLLWLALVAVGLVLLAPPRQLDERALDAVFGPNAESGLTEAAAQLVRGPRLIHDAGKAERRVFLLGGSLLYAPPDRRPDENLEELLTGDLHIAKKHPVDVPCLPTVDGWSSQQWRLFAQCYRVYRPSVLVFGVAADEGVVDPRTGKPRSHPSDLRQALGEAAAYARDSGCKLVLFAGPGLGDDFRAVMRDAAGTAFPLVEARADEAPAALSKRLAAVIAPLVP